MKSRNSSKSKVKSWTKDNQTSVTADSQDPPKPRLKISLKLGNRASTPASANFTSSQTHDNSTRPSIQYSNHDDPLDGIDSDESYEPDQWHRGKEWEEASDFDSNDLSEVDDRLVDVDSEDVDSRERSRRAEEERPKIKLRLISSAAGRAPAQKERKENKERGRKKKHKHEKGSRAAPSHSSYAGKTIPGQGKHPAAPRAREDTKDEVEEDVDEDNLMADRESDVTKMEISDNDEEYYEEGVVDYTSPATNGATARRQSSGGKRSYSSIGSDGTPAEEGRLNRAPSASASSMRHSPKSRRLSYTTDTDSESMGSRQSLTPAHLIREDPVFRQQQQFEPLTPVPGYDNSSVANKSISQGGETRQGKKGSSTGKKKGSRSKQPRQWAPRKKDLRTVLQKLLEAFIKKDAYGFFLAPVDTSIVTDYLSVIKTPMDFGTMQKKLAAGEYRDIDAFKSDFLLVMTNAKTYNAPSTIYYRTADRILQYGEKAIERERGNILSPEEEMAQAAQAVTPIASVGQGIATAVRHHVLDGQAGKQKEEEIDILELGDVRPTKNTPRHSQGEEGAGTFTRTSTPHKSTPNTTAVLTALTSGKKKKKKKNDMEPTFAPDGSLIVGESSEWISNPSFGKAPRLRGVGGEEWSARHLDYGPYAHQGAAGAKGQPAGQVAKVGMDDGLRNVYADQRGEAYVRSLLTFVEGMHEDILQYVEDRIERLTRGAHSVAKQLVALANDDQDEKMKGEQEDEEEKKTEVEFGSVKLLSTLKKTRQTSKQDREMVENCRSSKVDLDFLLLAGVQADTLSELQARIMAPDSTKQSVEEMLQANAKLIRSLTQGVSNDGDGVGEKEREKLLSELHTSLFDIARHAPLPELNFTPKIVTKAPTSTMATTTASSPMAAMNATAEKLANAAAIAPKRAFEGNTPTSNYYLSQSSKLPTATKIAPVMTTSTSSTGLTPAGQAQPQTISAGAGMEVKCTNCGTTETPGWRAGETPEQKLCNACGLYFQKNRAHRPRQLWTKT
ncbi:uncharacterized protein VTP21DRAFT_9567 [Calcarisporiella thermophila]|uniref:uncharacterized protein n=1 Tax=Calcarisporiella thermophila TaxID=911321 RepID=UPI0037424CF9